MYGVRNRDCLTGWHALPQLWFCVIKTRPQHLTIMWVSNLRQSSNPSTKAKLGQTHMFCHGIMDGHPYQRVCCYVTTHFISYLYAHDQFTAGPLSIRLRQCQTTMWRRAKQTWYLTVTSATAERSHYFMDFFPISPRCSLKPPVHQSLILTCMVHKAVLGSNNVIKALDVGCLFSINPGSVTKKT